MKSEELKALGLNEDQVSAVMELKGKYFGTLEKKNANLQTDVDALTIKLDDANQEIQSFKDLKVEDIQKAADDWKEKYENEKHQREEERFHSSLESIIQAAGGKNAKLIKAGLDLEVLRKSKDLTKDGASAVEAFKAENDYMFGGEENKESGVNVVKSGGRPESLTMTKDEIDKISNPIERLRAIKDNINLYE